MKVEIVISIGVCTFSVLLTFNLILNLFESFLKRMITRLNMLFIPTLPVKVEFNPMLRILGNAKNAKQGLGRLGGLRG